MFESREPLFDKAQTSQRIKALCRKYHTDLNGMHKLSPQKFFDFVRTIPYRRDKKPIEIVSRPSHILKYKSLGMDCKKKSLLLGSYFEGNGIPYRFIGSSRRQDRKIHHIFPQAKINANGIPSSDYINFDATYNNYRIGMPKSVTKFEIL